MEPETKLLNLQCIRTGKYIPVKECVSVLDANKVLVGWGWFEWEPDLRLFWFREDIHESLPKGMDVEVVDDIFNYSFELYEGLK